MKKIILILSFLISCYASFSQAFTNPRSNSSITVQDSRWRGLLNAYLPHTHGLTLNGGLDTLGALIYCDSFPANGIWYRDTVLGGGHKWTFAANPSSAQAPIQIQNHGSNSGTAGQGINYNFTGTGITAGVSGNTVTITVTGPDTSKGIISINGDTTVNALFLTGHLGTNFNITTSHGVNTWNIPYVNASDTGLVTPALYNTWNGKQNALTIGNTTSSTLSLSGNTGSIIGSGMTVDLNPILAAGSCSNCAVTYDQYGRATSYATGSAGGLTGVVVTGGSPLFGNTTAWSPTTININFSLDTASPYNVFGNNTSSRGLPSYFEPNASLLNTWFGGTIQGAITLTTTGSSGPSTLIGNTLNIPQYSGGGGGTDSAVLVTFPLTKSVSGTAITLGLASVVDTNYIVKKGGGLYTFRGSGDSIYQYSDSASYAMILSYSADSAISFAVDTSKIATQYDVSVKFTLPAFTQYSVPVATGTTLTQDNNNFYYNYSTHIFNVGTAGDFSGTNTINIYGQYDAYEPHSAISSVTNALTTPGITASTSRGTGASPAIDSIGDIIGAHSFWAYTGSSPNYAFMAGMVGTVQGSTLSNLGGQLDFYVKADNGSPSTQLTIKNTGILQIEHYTTNGGLLYTDGSGNIVQGSAPAHAGMRPYWNGSVVSWTDTTASGGGGSSFTRQVINSGTNTTVGGGNYVVTLDFPATVVYDTLVMPASPTDLQEVKIEAGGTITSGSVVANLTILPNTGQGIIQAATLTTMQAGEFASYTWYNSKNKWMRHN